MQVVQWACTTTLAIKGQIIKNIITVWLVTWCPRSRGIHIFTCAFLLLLLWCNLAAPFCIKTSKREKREKGFRLESFIYYDWTPHWFKFETTKSSYIHFWFLLFFNCSFYLKQRAVKGYPSALVGLILLFLSTIKFALQYKTFGCST